MKTCQCCVSQVCGLVKTCQCCVSQVCGAVFSCGDCAALLCVGLSPDGGGGGCVQLEGGV